MANVKLTELTAYTSPVSTDVLPIVDLVNNQTKKVTVADLLKRFGAGTASAPSFSFSGDIDTGIYSPGANQFAVTTGGTQRLLIDASGNTTIQGDLTVNGTTTTVESNTLSIKDKNIEIAVVSTPTDTTADGGGITLKGASDKTINWVQSTGCWTLNQPTNFNNHVRIDSNGLVGIGTDSPGSYNASADNLVIQNSGGTGSAGMTIRAGTGAQSTVYFADGTGASDAIRGYVQYFHNGDFLRFGTDANERLRIDSNGRLLLGTTTEGYATYADKLTIANAGHCGMTIRSGSSHNGSIYFSDATSGTSEYDGYIEYQHTDRRFLFGTATGSRMIIDSDGKIGVGTVSPASNLDFGVTSNGAAIINLRKNNNSVVSLGVNAEYGARIAGPSDATAPVSFGTISTSDGTTFSETARINSDGRLLVGTTETSVHADRLIEIGNTSRSGTYQAITTSSSGVGGIVFADTVTNDTGGYRGLIQYFHADDAMVLKTSSVEALRITSDGKVGIGTASADANLHIKGGYPTVHIERDHATNYARLLLDNTANDGGAIDGIGDGVGGLRFSTSDAGTISEKMRLDTSGRLNIGTTSGNAGRPVHIHTAGSGSSYFHSTNDGTGATASDGIVMGMGAAADAYIWNYESGMIQFGTNGGARMTIEGSGFVKAQAGYLYVQNPSVSGTGNADGVALIVDGNADAYLWNYENTTLRFGTNNQEAMRVDSSGRLLISKTASNFAVEGIELRQNGEVVATRDAGDVLTLRRLSSNGTVASFRETNGGVVGTIATTSSSTAYNTSSDYRLKENVVEIADGIARVKQLQPKRFNFIVDPDTTVDGFLAHEAQAVVPEAVTGEKDGEEMQGIDQSKIVPLLTAALQEAITKIETLETKVAQLEANN